MSFQIKSIAEKYVTTRFPRASSAEKAKIVKDWENKMRDSELLVEDFKKRVGIPKDKKIIDVGCGNGGISIAFALAGARVTGVDIESDLVSIAKEHASNYGVSPDFYLYDGGQLPFNNETFDYAISASVLEHTTDPVHYLNQVFRVLKKDGVLYLGFPNKLWPKETHTGLWFLTYIPSYFRESFVALFKKNPLRENNLHFYSYFDLYRMLKRLTPAAYVYIVSETGSSTSVFKKCMRKVLDFMGIPYRAFLGHILVLLKKND